MSKKIQVKYNGERIPFFAGKAIAPGLNDVDEDQFMAHAATSLGKREIELGIWEIVKDKPVAPLNSGEPVFVKLPIAKQKEQVGDMFDIAKLKELTTEPKLNAGVKKEILARIEELETNPDDKE